MNKYDHDCDSITTFFNQITVILTTKNDQHAYQLDGAQSINEILTSQGN